MRAQALVVAVTLAVLSPAAVLARTPQAGADSRCSVRARDRDHGVFVYGHCFADPSVRSGAGRPTRVVYCGRAPDQVSRSWDPACGRPRACPRTVDGKRTEIDAFATLTLRHHHWTDPQVWCPSNDRPGIDLPALRDAALRLLPRIDIGAAWSDMTLVNVQTLFWAGTPRERELAPVNVLGRRVALRIHFAYAEWDFGDGSGDTVTDPGKAYDATRDPCDTVHCPHYYGHTYVETGTVLVRLAVAWHAQYRPRGGTWTDISGEITGPSSTHRLVVKQARGVLVPNPGDH